MSFLSFKTGSHTSYSPTLNFTASVHAISQNIINKNARQQIIEQKTPHPAEQTQPRISVG